MNISNLCRSCMREIGSWESDIFDQRIAQMFSFCTQIEIPKEDKLPKQLCNKCTNDLEQAYTFVKQARDVNMTLLNLVTEQMTTVIIKPGHYYQKIQKNVEIKSNIDNNTTFYYTDNILDDFNDMDNQSSTIDITKTDLQNLNSDFHNGHDVIDEGNYKEMTVDNKEQADENDETDTFRTEQIQNNYKSDNKEVKHCPMCRKTFISELWFSRHMEREHTASKQFMCEQCNESFPTPRRLVHHRDTHTCERRHPCDTCGKRFKKRKQLTAHARAHRTDRPFSCDLCHMTFKIKSILSSHMKVHDDEKPFLCSVCGRGFRTASHLSCHTRLHTGVKPFACPQCPFRARFSASLRRHQLQHRADRRHVCGRCQKGFYESGALARHMRTHTGERPFQCPSCRRAFADGSKRKVHMVRVHQLSLEDIPMMHRDGRPLQR